jgi:hypothetical protein
MVPRSTDKKGSKKDENARTFAPREDQRTGPKPSAFVLGEALEYRVARLHLFMGYFVRRGCPIYTVAALDRATDLDVLAIRYVAPFQRQMIIAECKSGDNAPLDRLFWLAGVKNFTNADEALLVRKATKWNIKDFAKESGVQVLDLPRLAELELSLGIIEDEWPGVSDRQFFSQELNEWNAALKANPRFWELTLTLTSEVRWEEPFAGANYLLSQLRLLTRTFPQPPKESLFRFLLTEALAQLSVFLLRIVEKCFDLGEKDRDGFIRKGLTYGNLDSKYAERILESAYNLARQSVYHYTNRTVDIERQVFSMPEPPGTDQLLAFVDVLVRSYPACLIFPQVCDHVLLERFTKRREMRRMLRRMFPESTLGNSLSLAQQFVTTLVSMGACPSYIAESFARPEPDHSSLISPNLGIAGDSAPSGGPPKAPPPTQTWLRMADPQQPEIDTSPNNPEPGVSEKPSTESGKPSLDAPSPKQDADKG